MLINHEQIIDGLIQLGSEREQRRLWLREGPKKSNERSSFIEASCVLFDDSALMDKVESGGTEFGADVDEILNLLFQLTTEILRESLSQSEAIRDPRMARARALALGALRSIMSMGSRNSTRIIDRVNEWRDEERQKRLWLPTRDSKPRSSPYCADWHLFHGKDYWGYLDLGVEKRELSALFREMGSLVFRLKTYVWRPPKVVIADPLMEPIREMAARIAGKLGGD